jgi:hypothetical protein
METDLPPVAIREVRDIVATSTMRRISEDYPNIKANESAKKRLKPRLHACSFVPVVRRPYFPRATASVQASTRLSPRGYLLLCSSVLFSAFLDIPGCARDIKRVQLSGLLQFGSV